MAVMLANIQFSLLDSSLRTEEGPAMDHSWVIAQQPLREALGENAKPPEDLSHVGFPGQQVQLGPLQRLMDAIA